ncbi:Uncharacterised protein [Vibrio cholerae]|nr:Uncharacterised protein [Vibrio cholerae]CSI72204.1 Uncharacterised protein [Vibrio cholerae]
MAGLFILLTHHQRVVQIENFCITVATIECR